MIEKYNKVEIRVSSIIRVHTYFFKKIKRKPDISEKKEESHYYKFSRGIRNHLFFGIY